MERDESTLFRGNRETNRVNMREEGHQRFVAEEKQLERTGLETEQRPRGAPRRRYIDEGVYGRNRCKGRIEVRKWSMDTKNFSHNDEINIVRKSPPSPRVIRRVNS